MVRSWAKAFSDVKESKLWYKENFSFSKIGTYTLTLEHALRQTGKVSGLEDLEGLQKWDLELKKQNKIWLLKTTK